MAFAGMRFHAHARPFPKFCDTIRQHHISVSEIYTYDTLRYHCALRIGDCAIGVTTAEIFALGCAPLYTQLMKIPTTITLESAVRAALELAATSQHRSRSWVANQALARELLVDHQPPAPAQSPEHQEHNSK
jgi:hypothetical protein